ncbi:MAG: hypothetical protein ACFB50_05145 [Rubrobacteraceae bacterium]
MSGSAGGGAAPRVALIRVESFLHSAKDSIANDNRDDARQEIESAFVICDQIRGDVGKEIKRLVGNARNNLDSDSADETVEAVIDSALAEAENIRPNLN